MRIIYSIFIFCFPQILTGLKFPQKGVIPNKFQEIVKLSRVNSNFAPITVLSFLSGYATNPSSISTWIHSPPFLAAYTIVQCVTAASMTLNDIYDIDVDRINNPERPLVKKTVHIVEAKALVCLLLSITCFLGIAFLPPVLDPFWTMAIGIITIYTPILKKITFIKNSSCAIVVSSSVPFLGYSTINPLNTEFPDFHNMFSTWEILFFTSLYIEILLDIKDKQGDLQLGIPTIPVKVGETNSLLFLAGILSLGYGHLYINNVNPISIIVVACPMYLNLLNIYHNQFSHKAINQAIKQNIFIMLFYFSTLL